MTEPRNNLMGAPDEFNPEAHEEAREITGERDYGEWGQCIATAKSTGDRCRGYAKGPHGKCRTHGGDSPGAPDENENAVTHGAFREQFTSHLTDSEQEAFDDAYGQLETPESAQDVARAAASMCLLQFRRSGDERFLRRFEGLCDKFGIAPADELEVSGNVTLEDAFMADLKSYHGHGEEQ